MSYSDIRGAMSELIPDLKPTENDNAVCAVLRWAKRTRADVVDVGEVCAELGLDLSGALQRARGPAASHGELLTQRTRPTTPGDQIRTRRGQTRARKL